MKPPVGLNVILGLDTGINEMWKRWVAQKMRRKKIEMTLERWRLRRCEKDNRTKIKEERDKNSDVLEREKDTSRCKIN
jgi:hypothetical protein